MNPNDINLIMNNLSEQQKYEILYFYEKYMHTVRPEKIEKTQYEKDEEILNKIDIKNIESYLRKKKLQNLNK